MKKRILSIILAAIMTTAVLSGCTGGGTSTSSNGPDVKDTTASNTNAKQIKVEFFQQKTQEGPQKGYQAVIDAFQKENPGIIIEMNTVPDAGKVLTTRISSGDIPPIFSDYPTQLQFKQKVESGYVEKLSGQEFLTKVNQAAIDMSKANDGETYSLPLSNNFIGVYYNVDIFEKNNITIPTTYDEFIKVCETLKANNVKPLVQAIKEVGRMGHMFQAMTIAFTQNGVETIYKSQIGEANVAEDAEIRTLAEKMLKISSFINEDAFGMDSIAQTQEFANEKYAMTITGSYDYGTIKIANPNIKLGIFPLPNDTKETTNILTGVDAAVCISSKATAEQKEAGLKFLEFLSREENAQKFCDADGAPSCITAVKFTDELQAPVIEMIKSGQVHDWMASTINGNVVTELYNVTQGFFMEKNIDKYLKDMDSTIKTAAAQ